MGTTTDKINAILNTKENIKLKLNEKGVVVDDSVPFSEYPNKMDEISGGSGLRNTVFSTMANRNTCDLIDSVRSVKE